jgi:hypothetical protein
MLSAGGVSPMGTILSQRGGRELRCACRNSRKLTFVPILSQRGGRELHKRWVEFSRRLVLPPLHPNLAESLLVGNQEKSVTVKTDVPLLKKQ